MIKVARCVYDNDAREVDEVGDGAAEKGFESDIVLLCCFVIDTGAVHHAGFVSVTGTGFTQSEVDRQHDIGQAYFNLPLQEKGDAKYRCNFTQGNYFGYHARSGQCRARNIPKFFPANGSEPLHPFLRQFRVEIEDFSRHPLDLASRIFTLCSIILALPEDYFSEWHEYAAKSEDHLWYVRYHPRFWSAGYLKSTVHRVIRPPVDQVSIHRLGLFDFVQPGDEVDIKAAPPPLLRRLSMISEDHEDAPAVEGLEYVRERIKDYHNHNEYADVRGKTFKIGNLGIEDKA
ncbi:Clavaminate synthase-like protein [Amniculicola lignicola CBS 123094]|uniref:Clavaminate synthase-like protein n=1 Tax=Amniculicola lignicola CBS 123094 TaxID=1392246 RepID=A0A6A5WNL3_9PLEO|nr:Clavaminate synthase-like protein [Amniculicola lignicola CBS 123094]